MYPTWISQHLIKLKNSSEITVLTIESKGVGSYFMNKAIRLFNLQFYQTFIGKKGNCTMLPGFSDLRDEVPINAWNKPFLVMFMKYSIVTRIYTEILINQAVDNFTSSRFRESRLQGRNRGLCCLRPWGKCCSRHYCLMMWSMRVMSCLPISTRSIA